MQAPDVVARRRPTSSRHLARNDGWQRVGVPGVRNGSVSMRASRAARELVVMGPLTSWPRSAVGDASYDGTGRRADCGATSLALVAGPV